MVDLLARLGQGGNAEGLQLHAHRSPLLFIGFVVNAVDRGVFGADQYFGHGAVGQQHAVFNQLVGLFRLRARHHLFHLTTGIQFDLNFGCVDFHRAVSDAQCAHLAHQWPEIFQSLEGNLGNTVVAFAIDELLHLRVGQPRFGVDYRGETRVAEHLALFA